MKKYYVQPQTMKKSNYSNRGSCNDDSMPLDFESIKNDIARLLNAAEQSKKSSAKSVQNRELRNSCRYLSQKWANRPISHDVETKDTDNESRGHSKRSDQAMETQSSFNFRGRSTSSNETRSVSRQRPRKPSVRGHTKPSSSAVRRRRKSRCNGNRSRDYVRTMSYMMAVTDDQPEKLLIENATGYEVDTSKKNLFDSVSTEHENGNLSSTANKNLAIYSNGQKSVYGVILERQKHLFGKMRQNNANPNLIVENFLNEHKDTNLVASKLLDLGQPSRNIHGNVISTKDIGDPKKQDISIFDDSPDYNFDMNSSDNSNEPTGTNKDGGQNHMNNRVTDNNESSDINEDTFNLSRCEKNYYSFRDRRYAFSHNTSTTREFPAQFSSLRTKNGCAIESKDSIKVSDDYATPITVHTILKTCATTTTTGFTTHKQACTCLLYTSPSPRDS